MTKTLKVVFRQLAQKPPIEFIDWEGYLAIVDSRHL